MNTDTQQTPQNPVETEQLVVVKVEDGFRVFSPLAPANQFAVRESGETIICSCPDYHHHAMDDPEWRCKHIRAVIQTVCQEPEPRNQKPTGNGQALPQQNGASSRKKAVARANGGGQMLIKRSVSPDGHIDSLSVEFSCPVSEVTREEIKRKAEDIITLQSQIAQSFRSANGNGAAQSQPVQSHSSGAVPAQLLAIAGMNGKFGRRLFINVQVNGQVSKFFGSQKQLAEALTAAGYPQFAASVAEGTQLNVPCRVKTSQSPDGKYINVDQVLPAVAQNGG